MPKEDLYAYESDWCNYVFPEQAARFADDDEVKTRFRYVDFSSDFSGTSGLPVISDGACGYVNADTEMTIIFGGTGSKKTRTLIAPLICTLASAGESMVIMDVKGELSGGELAGPIRSTLDECGYDTVFLDFRNLASDGINILEKPYQLYKSGKQDMAAMELNNIATLISAVYKDSKADPFWEMSARQYFVSLCSLIFENCNNPVKVNMLTVSAYCNVAAAETLNEALKDSDSNDNAMITLKSILSLPHNTLGCVVTTLNSMLEPFINNQKLLRMLSKSTFSISDIYREKTAVFIIIPDEVSTYDSISGMIMQQMTSTLVNEASLCGGVLPRRVNLICDEFCNYRISNMNKNISAHRSRNIRWYLVCQSLEQLQKCYPEDAGTILANCSNLYYLNSTDLSLLNYLSEKSGVTTDNLHGRSIPLITVQQLQGLRKGRNYTEVYYTSGGMHYVTSLPDIGLYHGFAHDGDRVFALPTEDDGVVEVYCMEELLEKLGARRSLEELADMFD